MFACASAFFIVLLLGLLRTVTRPGQLGLLGSGYMTLPQLVRSLPAKDVGTGPMHMIFYFSLSTPFLEFERLGARYR